MSANRFAALDGKKIVKTLKEQCQYKAAQLIPCKSIIATGLGTGLGTTGNSAIVPTQITTTENEERVRRQREKALEASFEVMIQAVNLLNKCPNTRASIRKPNNDYFIPLTTSPKRFQWSYLDSRIKKRRSVLVADIQADGRSFWLIEFEQRKGEHFNSALVEILNYSSDNELIQLLNGLAGESGVWRKIKHQLGFRIISMKHTWSSPEEYANSIFERLGGKWLQARGNYD